jgi:hypothetical protein
MYVKTFIRLTSCFCVLTYPLNAAAQSIRGIDAPQKVVDLEISLYTNPDELDYPTGDSRGNHQSLPLSEQDRYEVIIQHFADAIFEITFGAHEIGNVTIHKNANRSDTSEIIWLMEGQPNVNFSATSMLPHGQVVMSDIFEFGAPGFDVDLLASDSSMRKAGYVLAQRWVQYYYGLFDEWKRFPEDVAVDSTLMSNPYDMASLTRTLSVPGDGVEPWLPREHTNATMQHYQHFSSAWDTLLRDPVNDAKYPREIMFGPRGNNDGIVLPDGPLSGRDRVLNIIWKEREITLYDDADLMFVLDVSGSMSTGKLANLKNAMRFMGSLAFSNQSSIGVVTFADTATVLWPFGLLETSAELAAFNNAIDAMNASGATNMKSGLQAAYNHLRSLGDIRISYVALLSDGSFNAGGLPFDLTNAYKAAGYRILGLWFPPGASSTLERLASETGGFLIETVEDFSELERDFFSVFINPVDPLSLAKYQFPASTQTIHEDIYVPSLAVSFGIVVEYEGPSASVVPVLKDPDGKLNVPDSATSGAHLNIQQYVIEDPLPGLWTMDMMRSIGSEEVKFRVELLPGKHEPVMTVESLYGEELSYPTPMILQASLSRGDKLIGADTLSGTLHLPSGAMEAVMFKDDGEFPDPVGGDGAYTLQYDYSEDGAYRVTFDVDSRSTAFQVSNAGSIVAPAEGLTPHSPTANLPAALTEPVIRTADFTVTVTDVRPDDHSDLWFEGTMIPIGNVEAAGRLETIDDTDYFIFNTGERDTITVRITNLGKNINEFYFLISGRNPGGLFDIWGGNFSERVLESPTGYLFNNFEVARNTNYYIEVENLSGQTEHTNYQISVGSLLPNEFDLNPKILDGSGGGSGGGGFCVISTVTYGTPLAQELDSIRAFRDRYLLTNAYGSELANLYYRFSPYWADQVREHVALKLIVLGIGVPVYFTIKQPLFWVVLAFIMWRRKLRTNMKYKRG